MWNEMCDEMWDVKCDEIKCDIRCEIGWVWVEVKNEIRCDIK